MTDPRTAVLFPGQGSQVEGMRETIEDARPDLLALAIDLIGDDPFERIDEGTRFQQPAIFCASMVGWGRVASCRPSRLAGHSLGEVAALVAAGALDEADGLRLVVNRGRLMQKAAELRPGGMIAVRAAREDVEQVVAWTGLALANDNAPRQVVLSGTEPTLRSAEAALAEAGMRCMRLPVGGAFHSPEMEPVAAIFRQVVESIDFTRPRLPVVSCITAAEITDPVEVLVSGLTRPVRWVETLHALRDAGIERFVDAGPGTVLAGLVRRTLPAAEAIGSSDLEAIGG